MDGVVLVSVVDGDPNMVAAGGDGGQQIVQTSASTPKKRKSKGEPSESATKVNKLTSRLRGREQSIKDLRKEIAAMQQKIADQTLQLQAKDVEYAEMKVCRRQLSRTAVANTMRSRCRPSTTNSKWTTPSYSASWRKLRSGRRWSATSCRWRRPLSRPEIW